MNLRGILSIAAIVVAGPLAIHACRKADPARHVQDISYPVVCLKCGEKYVLKTREMNDMIDRGEVESPPEQMRRFKCRKCGEKSVILDEAPYHETPGK
jgi:hypothetical protein